MKAYQLSGPGQAAFIDVSEPRMRPDEVLLRVRRVGMCGSDLSAYRGTSSMVRYPVVPGHEISAEVLDIGAESADGLEVGDLVTVLPYFSCGRCGACKAGRANACQFNETLGVQRPGALCEFISVPRSHVVTLSPCLSTEEAALIEPLSVGFHLANRSGVSQGEHVAVFGCGAVGLGAVAASSYKGARVTAVDIARPKLDMARRFGAVSGINSAVEDPVTLLLADTGREGVDVAIECVGQPATFLQALESVRFAGRVGIVSYSTKEVSFNTKLIVAKELDLHGSRNARDEFAEVQGMLLTSGVPFIEMITETVPFPDVTSALHRWSASPESFTKIMVEVGD